MKNKQWINVKCKLPSNDDTVLTFANGGIIEFGYYRSNTNQWTPFRDYSEYTVTYWMPLPEPPKE